MHDAHAVPQSQPPALRLFATLVLALSLALPVAAQTSRVAQPAAMPLGLSPAQLRADHWIDKLSRPDQRVLDDDAVAAQNLRLRRTDPTWHDIEALPQTLDGAQVEAWVEARSVRPERTLYDEDGKQGSKRQIDRLMAALDIGAIPQTQVARFGMVVRRASLRTFPTHLRVFSAPGDNDIDRFQETALFPGTPVAIVHASRDRKWWFVVSPLYAGWVERGYVAEGERQTVFGYVHRSPALTVTGTAARTVFAPGQPAVSEVPLDMGVRVPLLADWPLDRPINGQIALGAYAVELPARDAEGRLSFLPALLPRNEAVAEAPLPLTRANLLRQAFKFLGERYGWGHDYNGRDCSGFVSEVYRSMGVLMPRNTGDQARSPVFDRIAFDAASTPAQRTAAVRNLQVGDLVYIPGHVMMVIGRERGEPWVIHDAQGVSTLDAGGALRRLPVNGVVVTPLLPLQASETQRFVDRMTAIVRMRPVERSP